MLESKTHVSTDLPGVPTQAEMEALWLDLRAAEVAVSRYHRLAMQFAYGVPVADCEAAR